MEERHDIIPAFEESLFNNAYDIAPEYAEIAIDALFDDGVLKEIPIVRSVAVLCKLGYNIHERNLVKQTLSFLNGFRKGEIPKEKIEKHRHALDDDPKKRDTELSRALIILNNHIDQIQSKILGGFYKAFIGEEISWEKFCELAEANRRMFTDDYKLLLEAYSESRLNIQGRELYQVDN